MLSEKMNEIIEGCSFRVVEEDDNVYISQYTPCGEDWNEVILYDGTDEKFLKGLKERLEGFDVDEEVEVWVDLRGKNGVPSKISELLKDAEWKKEKIGVVLYKFVITKLLLDKIIERIGLIFLSALCVVRNFNF